MNLRIFKHSNFAFANITTLITTVGLFSGIFFVPLFLQNVKGLGALETGLLMLPGALASGLLMPIVGKLYDHTGPKPLAIFGIISLAYTTFLLHNINLDTSNTTIVYWMIIRGVGMSFAAVSAQAASLDAVSKHEVGDASAISNIVSRVSASLGIAALTTILTNRISFHAKAISTQLITAGTDIAKQGLQIQTSAFVKGLDDIFMIASILTLFGLIPALFLKKEVKGKNIEIKAVVE